MSEQAGAIDLSMDGNNPRILYASIFQVVRRPWTVISGGPDSGLWRSTDGGDTWVDISRNSGLPKGHVGRIGVASSPAKPGRVWALIEAEDGALFRSDDYGETWDRLSDKIELRERGWYYNHFFADTQDPGDLLRAVDASMEVDRWRADVVSVRHAARRPPRPMDRPPGITVA